MKPHRGAVRARAGAPRRLRRGQPFKQVALWKGLGINIEEDDVGKLQALGVVHRHDRHRALRGGTAASADSDIVLAQLAGNFFTTLISAGEHTD